MKKSFLLLFFGLLAFGSGCPAQSLTGITGMLNAPSAEMLEEGTFYAGANFLNRNFINAYGQGKYNCLIYYFDMTFLPFLELNFRNTRQLDNPDSTHTVDRMFSGKLRVLRERKYWPSIALGANDVFTQASRGNQYFGALYAVATKNIPLRNNLLGFTCGYAFPVFRNSQFEGVFGGITFSPSFLRQLTVMAEYDSRDFNFGGSVLFFRHLYVFALLQGFEAVTGGASVRIPVYSGIKSIMTKKKE